MLVAEYHAPIVMTAVVTGRDKSDYSYALERQPDRAASASRIVFYRELKREHGGFRTSVRGTRLISGLNGGMSVDVCWMFLLAAMRENGDNPENFDFYLNDKLMWPGAPLLATKE